MAIYKRPRGTKDWIGYELWELTALIQQFSWLATNYGYHPALTPTFEFETLFQRSVGTDTDIVSKEMYQFFDRKSRSLVLRPEGTAGIIRAVIENNWWTQTVLPLKLYYTENMFRYERPQAGRSREFWQWGVEVIGELSISLVLEVLFLAMSLLKKINLIDTVIHINHLSDLPTRKHYTHALVTALNTKKNHLCKDCLRRLETNPLRVLDCKHDMPKLRLVLPRISNFLNRKEKEELKFLKDQLNDAGYKVVIDPFLVRGLDYYTNIVFEIISTAKSQREGTLIGGGCYNDLMLTMGGPNLPAIGFAIGLERIILALKHQKTPILTPPQTLLYVLTLSEAACTAAVKLSRIARDTGANIRINFNVNRSLKAQYRRAAALGAHYTVVLGQEELRKKTMFIKNEQGNKKAEPIKIDFDGFANWCQTVVEQTQF